ncbi:MAG: DUF2125 domain-containing protein, partial [Alphaproteobacteria bacterium]
GFPLALRLNIDSPGMEHGADGRYWRGPAATISFRPWNLQRIEFSAPGTHRFGGGYGGRRSDFSLSAAAADGYVRIGNDGFMESLSVTLKGARFAGGPDRPETTARSFVVTLHAPAAAGSAAPPHRRPWFRLVADADGVDLPPTMRPALGNRIENLGLTAMLLGRLDPMGPPGALAAWRDSGGTVEIERLKLKWAALGLAADGTIALDRNMQPVGAMTARITGFRETTDALVAAGRVRPRDAVTARIVLGMLAKTPKDGGPPVITAPLSAQHGRLFIGPVGLLPLPRIGWH